jgi:hypothetical protein
MAHDSSGAAAAESESPRALSTLRFEAIYVALAALVVAGGYLDGWAHRHLESTLESFFTPWHALLYGAYLATAGALAWAVLSNRYRGLPWRRAIPVGYGYPVAGAILFAVAGGGDLAWHSLFGIEVNAAALLSPTHLALATGLTLMVAAPFRAWQARPTIGDPPATHSVWPAITAVVLATMMAMFITQFVHPYTEFWPTYEPLHGLANGINSVLVQSVVIAGAFVLLALHLRPLPIGTVTLLLMLPAAGMAFLADRWLVIPIALAAAGAGEALVAAVRRDLARPVVLRAATLAILIVLWAIYDAVLAHQYGITWSVHLWAGTIVLGGLVGWLVAYVATSGVEGTAHPVGPVLDFGGTLADQDQRRGD